MLRQPEKEVRPQAHDLRATESTTATGSSSSLLEVGDVSPLAYVVIVSSTDSRARRRPFLSLHSAERAIERAEARGHVAALHLCRLVPVLPGDEIGEAAC